MKRTAWKRAALLSVTVGIVLLTQACAKTTVAGDVGCAAYAERRLAMPRDVPLGDGPWPRWIADTDNRMTGACST